MRLIAAFALGVWLLPAQTPERSWSALQSLAGEWIGEGSGEAGRGAGAFSFTPDLEGAVLVRKSYAEYPATKDRPAFRHDDLLIIYREGERQRAIYFDNERHVIRYDARVSADGREIVLLSEAAAGAPQYRFTYTRLAADRLQLRFEIAPPGRPFATYLEAAARRRAR